LSEQYRSLSSSHILIIKCLFVTGGYCLYIYDTLSESFQLSELTNQSTTAFSYIVPKLLFTGRPYRRRCTAWATASVIKQDMNKEIHLFIQPYPLMFTRYRSLMRHRATSRKVAGSIPDIVIANFLWHNPSGRTITLRST
jgi:hypothetical protein